MPHDLGNTLGRNLGVSAAGVPTSAKEKRLRYAAVFMGLTVILPGGLHAATLGECVVEKVLIVGDVATCQVTNDTETAIASLRYAYRVVEEGREVPWLTEGYDGFMGSLFTSIPGGIEPGETVPVRMQVRSLPERADPERVRYVFEITEAADVNGDPIEFFREPGPPMTDAEWDAFHVAVQQCWVVDPGSQAGRVSVTVAFQLGRDGRVAGDVELLSHTADSGDAAGSAYESARRAILRCQGGGFPLPAEKYEQWRTVEMAFDPTQMMIR
jgi:hypothetical protein